MSEAYIGEVRIFAGNFAPRDWMMCDGSLLPIAQNTALFSILGTTYGGNGQTTFALPQLDARMPMHAGQGVGLSQRFLGEFVGEATIALSPQEMPTHNHTMQASPAVPAFNAANGHVLAKVSGTTPPYHDPTSLAPAVPAMLQPNGGSQPHNNRQPYLTLSFIICTQGIFPPRN
jgi:microcystin-dependent protein